MLSVSSLNMVSTYYLVSAVSCSEPKTLSMTKNNWAELEQQAAYMRVRVFWPGFDRAGEIKKEKKFSKVMWLWKGLYEILNKREELQWTSNSRNDLRRLLRSPGVFQS